MVRVSFLLGAVASASAALGCGDRRQLEDAAPAPTESLSGAPADGAGQSLDEDISPLALLPGYAEIYKSAKDSAAHAAAVGAIGVKGISSAEAPTWQDQRGTALEDVAMGVAVGFERTGNVSGYESRVFTAGYTRGAMDGNAHGGGFQKADVFIARHETNGTHRWTKQLGGLADDFATDIAVQCNLVPDPQPSCAALHASGYSAGAFDGNVSAGGIDAILIKLDLNGNKLWSRQLGSTGADYALGVASDSAGNSYIAGYTNGVLPGQTRAGNNDAFLAKYDAAGNRLWVRQFGTPLSDQAQSVAVDADGNAYVGGLTFGDLDGAGPAPFGADDAYVAKFSPAGTLQWIRQSGTPQSDSVLSLAISKNNGTRVYAAGYTGGSYAGTPQGAIDAIAVGYDLDGAEVWRRQFGTPGVDYVHGVASDGGNNIYISGESNYDLNTKAGNPSLLDYDSFLAKYDEAGAFALQPQQFHQRDSANHQRDTGLAVAADFDSGVYIAGRSAGNFARANLGGEDAILYRYGDGCTCNSPLKRCHPGGGWGDPHLTTFDGLAYDFQGAGEFVVVEGTGGNDFMVQGRQQPWGGSSTRVTVTTGVAAKIGAHRVAIYADRQPTLWIDGNPTTLGGNRIAGLSGGGMVYRRAGATNYVLSWPSGERLVADVVFPHYINVQILLPAAVNGKVHGLYGNFNGDRRDDFTLRDGTQLPQPLSFAEMYGFFAESWRLDQAESLFDYLPGESTDSFTIHGFPSTPAYVTMLPAAARAMAQAACAAVGALNPALLEGCILDVATTGETDFAAAAAGVEAQNGGVDVAAPEPVSRGAYFAGFDDSVGNEWSPRRQEAAPSGSRTFLGPYGEEQVDLAVADLAPHTSVTMSFDVVVKGGWDGEGPLGPHFFNAQLGDGTPLLTTTFSNTSSLQTFPGEYPGFRLPGSGAAEQGTLGYVGGDAVYTLSFTFPHSGSTFDLSFFASGIGNAPGAAWGLDNLDVQTHDGEGLMMAGKGASVSKAGVVRRPVVTVQKKAGR